VGLPVVLGQPWGSWRVAGLMLAALMLVPLGISVAATAGRDAPGEVAPHRESMWSVLRNRAFRRTSALFLAAWSSIAVLSALVPFYVEHHLRHPELLDATFAAIQLSALACIPGVVWLAARREKHLAYAALVGSWALVMLFLAAVPQGAATTALFIATLAGPGVAAAHVLPWSMLPDVVELDRAEQGLDRAGAFYGVMTFLEKLATALALWGLGLGLQLAGYEEGAATQPELAQLAIRVLIGPVPAVVLVLAAIGAVWLPPLTRDAHRQLVERLHRAPAGPPTV
ncbi:MAG: MFS transporter, partial [Myxococcales bacterium]|nr:MFS transporter [Myxococcales bacterium]